MNTAQIYKDQTTPKETKQEKEGKEQVKNADKEFQENFVSQERSVWISDLYTQTLIAKLQVAKKNYLETAMNASNRTGDPDKEKFIQIILTKAETLNTVLSLIETGKLN